MTVTYRGLGLVACVALIALLPGCGGDDDPAVTVSVPLPPTEAPVASAPAEGDHGEGGPRVKQTARADPARQSHARGRDGGDGGRQRPARNASANGAEDKEATDFETRDPTDPDPEATGGTDLSAADTGRPVTEGAADDGDEPARDPVDR